MPARKRRVVDARCDHLGKRVICSEETWLTHILVRHPEMGRLCIPGPQAIAETVTRPEVITDDGVPGGRSVAYYAAAPPPFDRFKIRVVARVGRLRARIVTRSPAAVRIRKGGGTVEIPVSADNPRPIVAPTDNEEGLRQAIAQGYRVRQPGWTITADRRADALYLRAPDAGPAISYWVPKHPHVFMRLDVYTGELTGVDVTELHDLMRRDALWRSAMVSLTWAMLIDSIPGLRWLLRGWSAAARDRVRERTSQLNPA